MEILCRLAVPILADVPVCGCLGDQQAALMGQGCLEPGSGKVTFGTGAFFLMRVASPDVSPHGLLTTVACRLGPEAAIVCS